MNYVFNFAVEHTGIFFLSLTLILATIILLASKVCTLIYETNITKKELALRMDSLKESKGDFILNLSKPLEETFSCQIDPDFFKWIETNKPNQVTFDIKYR